MAEEDAPYSVGWQPLADNPQVHGNWNGQEWTGYIMWDGSEWIDVMWDGAEWIDVVSETAPNVGPGGFEGSPRMGIASLEQKQEVINALKNANKKYAKPFEQGRMASVSIFGGNWESYAQIVMDMVSADTLLEIQGQLETLNRNIETLIEKLSES